MKILKVQFENINSLAGSWEIDFADSSIDSEGLFVITGNTGAGKSTILDAISLGLYGKTVRQSENGTAGLAEVVSKGQSKSASRVTFESDDGKVYRAEWELAISHGDKSKGKPKTASLKLFDFPSPTEEREISAGSKTDKGRQIEEKVGLSFEQFLRSMILAQGQFDSFLKSNDEERAAILESATGTEIYTQIGHEIFERTDKAKNAVKDTQNRLDEHKAMSPEEKILKEAELREASKQAEELEARISALQEEKQWHDEKRRLEKENEGIKKRERENAMKKLNHGEELKKLESAEKAGAYKDRFNALESLRRDLKKASDDEKDLKKKLEESVNALDQCEKDLPGLQILMDEAKSKQEENEPLIKKARALDAEISSLQKDSDTANDKLKKARNEKSDLDKKREDARQKLEKAEASLEFLKSGKLEDLKKAQLLDNELTALANEKEQLAPELERLQKELETAEKKREESEKAFDKAQKIHDAEAPHIDARIKAATELNDLAKFNYEEVRTLLKEGMDCPVCGRKIEKLEWPAIDREKCQSDLQKALNDEKESNRKLEEARSARDQAAKVFGEVEKKRNKAEKDLDKCKGKIENKTVELEIDAKNLKENIQDCSGRLSGLDLPSLENASKEIEDKLKVKKDQRADLGLPEDLLKFNSELQEAYSKSKQDFGLKKQEKEQQEKRREDVGKSLESNREKQKILSDDIDKGNGKFLEAIKLDCFNSEEEWQACLLDSKEMESLRKTKQEIENEKVAISEAKEQHAKSLSEHAAKPPSSRAPEEVQADLEARQQEGKQKNEAIGSLKAELKQNGENEKRIGELTAELKEKEAEKVRWETLNKLLGQKDGKLFRTYAQGLTLSRLLKVANEYLEKMTCRRYSLTWLTPQAESGEKDGNVPRVTRLLMPSIVDHDMHDATRSVSNISGGERFLVSFSLALGLSRMSSGKVRIKTMFMDEGFGSLDSEYLEKALQILGSMKHDGATVGVISHIDAITDGIGLKIEAKKLGNGRSELVGLNGLEQAVTKLSAALEKDRSKTSRRRK